jgi:hypothetical protein
MMIISVENRLPGLGYVGYVGYNCCPPPTIGHEPDNRRSRKKQNDCLVAVGVL